MSIIIGGQSKRGPTLRAIDSKYRSLFSENEYVQVDLSTYGDTEFDYLERYGFYRYGKRWKKETEIKSTGVENTYRLVFPVVPDSVSITIDGVPLSLTTSLTPSTSEFYIDYHTGFLKLGNTYNEVELTYQSNCGAWTRIDHPYVIVDTTTLSSLTTISWSALSTLTTDEVWLKMESKPDELGIDTILNYAQLGETEDYTLIRVDNSTAALLTISCDSGTLVLKSDPGTHGNLWRAVWDTDCIHILRAPEQDRRRWCIPLTAEAATRWGENTYPLNEEDFLLRWGHVIESISGTVVTNTYTPGSGSFTGGSLGTVDWTTVIDQMGVFSERIYILPGARLEDIETSMVEAEEVGYWPIAIITATSGSTIDTQCKWIAAVAGGEGYEGLLGDVAGCLIRENPYYLKGLYETPPKNRDSRLIYPYETATQGWMLSRLPMLQGELQLNHHIWLQNLAKETRRALEKYLGVFLVSIEEVSMDRDFMSVMSKYGAEYQLTLDGSTIEAQLLVRPVGMVSEVEISVRATQVS